MNVVDLLLSSFGTVINAVFLLILLLMLCSDVTRLLLLPHVFA